MAACINYLLITERASWERKKEASNRLQTEAVLSFITVTL